MEHHLQTHVIGWRAVIAWTFITGVVWACACITGYPAIVLLGMFLGLGQMMLLRRYGIIRRQPHIWSVVLSVSWAMVGVTFLLSTAAPAEPGIIAAVIILFLLLHEVALERTIGSFSWGVYPLISLASAVLGFWGAGQLFRLIFSHPNHDFIVFLQLFVVGCFHGAATGIAGFFLLKQRRQLPELMTSAK